jgi:hypothetical protein
MFGFKDAERGFLMRRFLAAFLSATLLSLTLPAGPALAAANKELQNVKGDVSYTTAENVTRPLAPRSTVTLDDDSYAITRAQSLGGVNMPDSSRILIGQNTKIQLVSFTQTAIANAQFFITVGKVRFSVIHPKGARANYTFKTPTAQIAVRGTQGDISVDPSGNVQVNVYSLTDPNLPVQVTGPNGQVVNVGAGQTVTIPAAGVAGVAGTVTATTLSQAAFTPFTEFGLPQGAAQLGLSGPLINTTIGPIAGTPPGGVFPVGTNPGIVAGGAWPGGAAASSTGALGAVGVGGAAAGGAAAAVGAASFANTIFVIIGTALVNTIVHTVQNTILYHAPASTPAPTSTSVPIVIH